MQKIHYVNPPSQYDFYKRPQYTRPVEFFGEYAYRSTSNAPVYYPSTHVAVHPITRQTDPHLGSNEFYSDRWEDGVKIIHSMNNIFIPQLAP